jgi:hypothetical protein
VLHLLEDGKEDVLSASMHNAQIWAAVHLGYCSTVRSQTTKGVSASVLPTYQHCVERGNGHLQSALDPISNTESSIQCDSLMKSLYQFD